MCRYVYQIKNNVNIEWNGIISNIKTFTSGIQESFQTPKKTCRIYGYGYQMKDNVNVKWNKLLYNIKTSTSDFQESISRK